MGVIEDAKLFLYFASTVSVCVPSACSEVMVLATHELMQACSDAGSGETSEDARHLVHSRHGGREVNWEGLKM
jgi:hypothetical protein